MRPFPSKELSTLCKNAKAVGVLEKDISFGYEGTVYTNVKSALFEAGVVKPTRNFIAGLGGRDISADEIEQMFKVLIMGNIEGEEEKISFTGLKQL